MVGNVISLFPLWAILASVFAYFVPSAVVEHKSLIVPLLMIIMFCMGVTLTIKDFTRAIKRPRVIALTILLQFLLMPAIAFVIAKLLNFPIDLVVGMVLVGAVSGGTASNVMVYLAKADVALSITMTAISTLLSVIVTPFIVELYVGTKVPVNAMAMLMSIFKIVFIPVVLGMVINLAAHKLIDKTKDIFALFSIAAIVFIIAIVVGLNQERIATVGLTVMFGVILHNLLGMASGYYVAKLLGHDKTICRTVAIEVGMQNSGLAVALATKHFAALSALPGALFSVWHNISGSIVAGYWSKKQQS